MKKTLIALTLAALPVASMAEVTLFGTIKGGLEFTKVKGAKNTVTNANDWDSSIGFKGEEDLGNGLKAIWQLQSKASIDAKSGRNGQRNNLTSFIGLDAGTFGKLRAGNLPDAIKDMGDLNLDDSGHGVRALDHHWERTGSRHTSVRYDTANFGGFSASVLYSPEDNQRYDQARKAGSAGEYVDTCVDYDADAKVCNAWETKPTSAAAVGDLDGLEQVAPIVDTLTRNTALASVGLNYSIAGFFVKYGLVHQIDKRGVYNSNVQRIMGGYDANNLFVGLGYQYTRGFDDAAYKTSEIALSAAYRIGNVVPRFSYVHGFKEKDHGATVPDSKYDQVVLGADYYLSKRTTVITSLGWMKEGKGKINSFIYNVDNGKKSDQAYSFGLGLRHKF